MFHRFSFVSIRLFYPFYFLVIIVTLICGAQFFHSREALKRLRKLDIVQSFKTQLTLLPAKLIPIIFGCFSRHMRIHAVFFTSILFISIIRLKYGKNKHNLSITKAQILAQDELKNEQN